MRPQQVLSASANGKWAHLGVPGRSDEPLEHVARARQVLLHHTRSGQRVDGLHLVLLHAHAHASTPYTYEYTVDKREQNETKRNKMKQR